MAAGNGSKPTVVKGGYGNPWLAGKRTGLSLPHMIHPATELRLVNPHVGYGVFASRLIPMGSLVFVQDPLDIEVAPDQYASFNDISRQIVEKYSYIDARGIRILSWDIAKYVNHSCQPNTISTGWGFEIALRDIEPGEEITDEYSLFNLDWEMDCCCGHPVCRGRIRPTDAMLHARIWDRSIRQALAKVHAVEQPLLEWLDAVTRQSLDQYLSSGSRRYFRSVRGLLRSPTDHALAG